MCWWRWGGRFVLGYLCVTCALGSPPPSPPESPKSFLMTYFGKIKVDILVSNLSWQVQKTKQVWWKTNHKKKNTKKENPTHQVRNLFPTRKIMSNRNKFQPRAVPGISHLSSHVTDLFCQAPGNPAMCMWPLSVPFLCCCSPILSHCLGGGVITR